MAASNSRSQRYLLLVTFISALCGFLFGYDTGVISGALLFLAEEFTLDTMQQSLIVSIAIAGAIFGAVVAGILADLHGRRPMMLTCSILFIIGSIELATAKTFMALIGGRMIVGVAIGIASNTAPVYIAEMAPPENRGALVALNIVTVAFGQLISYITCGLLSYLRLVADMLGLAAVPAVVQVVCTFFWLPETPRWLTADGNEFGAMAVLVRLRQNEMEALEEFEMIRDSIGSELIATAADSHMSSVALKRALCVGMGLQALQQLVGINAVMYFGATVFQAAGVAGGSKTGAIWYSVICGACITVGSIVSMFIIDKRGRRPVLLLSLLPTGIGLLIMAHGFAARSEQQRVVETVFGMLLYLTGFACGIGPVTWTINSEIYPLAVRAKANSAATTVNWTCNFFVSLLFLPLMEILSASVLFLIFFGFVVISFVFVAMLVPETKDKSMEEIQASVSP